MSWQNSSTQIALFDVNNFYISAERAFDPRLRHKPVAVVSNNDGCVIARCAQVKAMGVKMATPLFQVRDRFRERGVVVLSSNYTLYHDMSNRFVQVLEYHCDDVQQYSIDESFLFFSGYGSHLEDRCQKIVDAVKRWTSMPCCAGIAPTRTLAKASNHFAKTLGVPGGVLEVRDEYHRQQLLRQLPVEEVWGVGRRLAKRLFAMGITTAWDLSIAHIPTIRKGFGVVLERTIRELNGVSCIELAPMDQAKNEVVSGRTFGQKVCEYSGVMAAVANHVMLAWEKLAAQNGLAGRLVVSLQRRLPEGELREVSAYTEMRPATNEQQTLIAGARRCLDELFVEGYEHRRASVMLSDLEVKGEEQTDLFANTSNRLDAVNQCIVAINSRFGRGKITLGSAKLSAEWEMQRSFLSPAYTTDFKEVPKARVDS